MTTTFDGSTGGVPQPPASDPRVEQHDPAAAEASAWGPSSTPDAPESLLDQLFERVSEREEAETPEWVKEVPKIGIRLVFDTDIDNAEFQRWMKAAQPKGRRRQRAGAFDMDQLALSTRALIAKNLRIEVKGADGKAWNTLTAQSGEALTLESPELLRRFNALDAGFLLKKLFGRDAFVIDAGNELLEEAGYLGDGVDDDDPA